MKTFKKSNANKQMKVDKSGSAKIAIGKIEKNQDVFILTFGQFSLIDALVEILGQTGPAHVIISTWTAAHAHLDRSAELMETTDILSLKMIIDRSFKTRQPKYYAHMIDLFGLESIRSINTHAKFLVIKNDKWDIVVRTSMNLNGNPRLENLEISDNKEFADFFQAIADDVFLEVQPGELKSDDLKLDNIKETSQFNLVEANHIKRSTLNEPEYTHTIC